MAVILGVSCFYHDSAAALVVDGQVVAAASEERFTRKKHDSDFPVEAARFVLRHAGLTISDVDHVGFYDRPFVKFERIMASHVTHFPRSFGSFRRAVPLWLNEKLLVQKAFHQKLGWKGPITYAPHHHSHAASAFLASPFEEAALLVVDGVGEWATTSWGIGRGNRVELMGEIRFPHSLGLLYSTMTGYLGFKVNSAEYKVMGLAPYGENRWEEQVKRVLKLHKDGSFALDMKYFDFDFGMRMHNEAFCDLFGGPARTPDQPLEQRHKDIARSLQEVLNEALVLQTRNLRAETGLENLCMAGGVALNCVANGHVWRESGFRGLFIQPAAGDAGGALGVALHIHCELLEQTRSWVQHSTALGPEYTPDEIQGALDRQGARYQRLEEPELLTSVAKRLDEGKVVGWFQGRMEFGPRALGQRSILADPRRLDMRDTINLKIKFREGFRPFAPSVLEEHAADWFELEGSSPFMLLVAPVREERRSVPSITHVDGSARIQTVPPDSKSLYRDLLEAWHERTGCPMLINTSFNVRGEPIVCEPFDALQCFLGTHMDALAIGPFLLDKSEQPPNPNLPDLRTLFPAD